MGEVVGVWEDVCASGGCGSYSSSVAIVGRVMGAVVGMVDMGVAAVEGTLAVASIAGKSS